MSSEDAARATDALQKLRRHETQQWVLTGGFATEIHSILRGLEPSIRSLNDIDFVVSSFDALGNGRHRSRGRACGSCHSRGFLLGTE